MKKRVLSLVLTVALIATFFVGCAGSKDKANTNEEAGGEKQLAVQIGPNPETIDPALNSSVDGGNMILHLFEGLLTVDKDEHIAQGCAEKWDVSEDGLTWTFTLRDGLKWSDGSDMTAEDFVYSWKRVCDPKTAAPYAETVLGMVKGYQEAAKGNLDALAVSAQDAKTFVVELATPCTYFDSLAAFATLSPVQKATIEANGDAWATKADTYVSNGPFKVTEWVPDSHITVSKNENYWNASEIKLDSIKFVLMEDANAAYSAYQNGEILLAKDVPTEEIPSLKDNKEFHVDPIIGTYYISLNDAKEPFTNESVRKALSLAIDRDYVASEIMQGTYTAAYNFMGPGWVDTDGTEFMKNSNGGKTYISDDFEANLAEAKKLMEDAGYSESNKLKLTYSTNDAGYHKAVAEYLQEAWAEINVEVKVDIVEWSSFTPMRRNGDYQVSRNGWVGDYTDPSNMLELLYTTNGNNDGKFSDANFDAAIDKSRQTVDAKERSEALHKAEDIMMEKSACIPVAYYNDFWLESPKVEGIWHSPRGYWYFMYADIAE
ncbi:MAG: ABC transporter substrate-binding protein [Clostridiaceae bacterium]